MALAVQRRMRKIHRRCQAWPWDWFKFISIVRSWVLVMALIVKAEGDARVSVQWQLCDIARWRKRPLFKTK